jgi:DNA-binding SARP family transcriptional activator/tetratricopeptide (TPR) repeat protein
MARPGGRITINAMATLELRLLGTVEARVDGRTAPLGPRKQRLVLAILALEANRQVPVERLVDLVWPDGPPRTATHAVRVCVSGLRAALAGTEADIQTRGTGYLFVIDPSAVDAHRFRELAARARESATEAHRVALLDEALGLWSGPALDGAAPPATRERLCAGLEDARLAAVEDRADALLRLGRHGELVDELTNLVAAHPLRERLAGQQMLALYRGGRTGDALTAYQRIRSDLAEQLGLDPDGALQRLQAAILRGEDPAPSPPVADATPTAGPPPARPIPAQLPAAVDGFAGRADELSTMDGLGETATVVVVGGTAGVGKTALAVHWAHRRRDWYPDGQLYLNLRGRGPGAPVRPEQALGGFLRALGVPAEEIPLDVDEAAARYRTLLAGRRMLVVLDNAAGVDQVRPLLPGAAGCLALVTSRDRLAGLAVRDGARLLRLETLDAEQSAQLLTGLLGARRMAAAGEAAVDLARLCGRLPLALRIAAAQLVRHPGRPIADLVNQLREGDRLAMLEIEGDEQSAVRAAFDQSYVGLKPEEQRAFRLAGLLPGTDFTVQAAAALTGAAATQTGRSLARLVDAHLLDEPVPGRYLLHDLLRLYAQTLAGTEDAPLERAAALRRLGEFYVRSADAAAARLYPQMQRLPPPPGEGETTLFADAAAALAWLEAERGNLVAAAERAAAVGPRPVAWLLVDALRGYFWMRRHTDDWLAAGAAALAASTVDGDEPGLAAAHLCLAQAHRFLSHHDAAVEHFRQAVAHAERAGWPQGEAAATGSIANLYRDQGRLADAADYHRRAGAIFRRIGGAGGEAVSLTNLGNVQIDSGALREGAENLDRALEIYRRIGAHNAQAHALNSLGCAQHLRGNLDAATEHLDRALRMHREAGSREGEADTLNNLAEVHLHAGRLDEARRMAEASLALAVDAGDRRVEADASHTLAVLDRLVGGTGLAADERALAVAQAVGYRRGEAVALVGVARSRLGTGELPRALTAARAGLEAARHSGYRLVEAEALAALAEAELAGGQPNRAAGYARESLEIHRYTGSALGKDSVLRMLAATE